MRIGLDATYSLGAELSGVGVYSREILNGLAAAEPAIEWDWFYRSQRYFRALGRRKPRGVTRRLLSDSAGNREAELFHGLNQRLPKYRFRRQIATFHDLFVLSGDYSTPEFRKRFAAQAREAASRADLIVAVSEFTASQVESLLGVPRSAIRVIHHGVTPRVLPELPREKIVLCTGALQKRKNQRTLIRAFEAMPAGWTLVLAGSEGYASGEILAELRSSSRAADVQITGYITDAQLASWYARASVFAFPSLDEGFGMPVLEAMAAGIPVVAGNRSALPEVCGDAALMADPEDEQAVARGLLLAIQPDVREKLLRLGHERAKHFSWKHAVEQTLAVYRELLPGL